MQVFRPEAGWLSLVHGPEASPACPPEDARGGGLDQANSVLAAASVLEARSGLCLLCFLVDDSSPLQHPILLWERHLAQLCASGCLPACLLSGESSVCVGLVM